MDVICFRVSLGPGNGAVSGQKHHSDSARYTTSNHFRGRSHFSISDSSQKNTVSHLYAPYK